MRHVRWDIYERLLADHEDVRSPRFTYDRGVLEVMVPGTLHEGLADLLTEGLTTPLPRWLGRVRAWAGTS